MFSRAKNSSLQRPKKLHSVDYLKYLYRVLQKNCGSEDFNAEEVIESLRLFSEIIVWGDQNDGAIMDFFWEQNALELLIRYIKCQRDRNISIQLLQTLNILFENLTNDRAIYYLLSQNHTNGIILHDFDFTDEEVIGYYIAFLKALSFRVNPDTVSFFYDEGSSSFPLYQRALQFFNHSESMVRIAVRTITLNIFKVRHVPCSLYVYAHTAVPYFSHVTEEIRRTTSTINEAICLSNRLANRSRIEDLVAESGDHLHYIDDIFALGIPDLTNVLFLILLQRFLLPVYVNSLTKRYPPSYLKGTKAPEDSTFPVQGCYLFHALAMFLLAQVFTILHQPELIRILTEAILIGDLSLLPVSPPITIPTNEEEVSEKENSAVKATEVDDVIPYLRAALQAKRTVRSFPPGSRLQAFVKILSVCGTISPQFGGGGWSISSSLNDDIARCSKSIRNFLNNNRPISCQSQTETQTGSSDSLASSLSSSGPFVDLRLGFDNQISVPPAGTSPPASARCPSRSSSLVTITQNNDKNIGGENFTLTGRPFLRAIFRSLEVGPGTDYDTVFALSVLIAIKRNGGLDEGTLALAHLHTPTQDSPSNPLLVTKLLNIISDATKMGSRVRVVTLNLALFLLVLVTRDASRNCQLTESQRQQLERAFVESRSILRNLYLTEPDFADIFEYEVCRFREQKLCPSKILENTDLLLSHAEDAFKLFSNCSHENLTELHNSTINGSFSSTPLQSRVILDGPPYNTLPYSELEHMQRIIAVYICLHGYLGAYIFTGPKGGTVSDTGDPLNEVTPPSLERISAFASFGNIQPNDKVIISTSDLIDTTEHRFFSCVIEHQNGRTEKRYFIVTDVQIIFFEPSRHKVGWGIVTFSALIQDTVVTLDSTDNHTLNIVVYKPGDRCVLTVGRIMTKMDNPPFSLPNVFPRMTAKLRFPNSPCFCPNIFSSLTLNLERIRAVKQEKLKQLLKVQDKQPRPSAQFILTQESLTPSPSRLPPAMLRPLKTISSAPNTLLQKASSFSTAVGNHFYDSTMNKEDMQEIALVDLSRGANNNKTPSD